jgi:hypothetical protein
MASKDSLLSLSIMANKIYEVNETNTVAAVTIEKQCSCKNNNTQSAFEIQLNTLTKAVEELTKWGCSYDKHNTRSGRSRYKSYSDREK